MARSRISTIRIRRFLLEWASHADGSVLVGGLGRSQRPVRALVIMRGRMTPTAWHPCRATAGDEYGRHRSFRCSPRDAGVCREVVEQARHAFDGFIEAAHRAFHDFEGHAETARKGARDVTEKAMTSPSRTLPARSSSAQSLLRAKDLQDVMKLQADYFRRQMQMFTEQARELGESTSKAARDAAAPNADRAETGPSEKALQPGLDCASQYLVALHLNHRHMSRHQPRAVAFRVGAASDPWSARRGSAVGADPCEADHRPQRTHS